MRLIAEFSFTHNSEFNHAEIFYGSINSVYCKLFGRMRIKQFDNEPLPNRNGSILGMECVGNITYNGKSSIPLMIKLYKDEKLAQVIYPDNRMLDDINIDLYAVKDHLYKISVFELKKKRRSKQSPKGLIKTKHARKI